MAQTIIIEAPVSSSSLSTALNAVAEAGVKEPVIISERPAPPEGSNRYISSPLSNAIREAVGSSRQMVVLNAAFTLSAKDIKKFLTDVSDRKAAYAGIKLAKGKLELAKPQLKTIIPLLSANSIWPAAAFACPANLTEKLPSGGIESAVELIAELMIVALGNGMKLEKASDLSIPEATLAENPLQLTAAEAARCLKLTVENCNIEDLFPSHPWNKFQGESLSASYHSLGALFLRLGDFDSADSALSQSLAYEDSPRALALRGLLAIKRGDFLGASAHLIASLQQYEIRLKDEAPHYVTFTPRNFKKINEMLLSGLGELNRRDNQTASQRFLDAIFLYDGFFHEHGVAKISALQ